MSFENYIEPNKHKYVLPTNNIKVLRFIINMELQLQKKLDLINYFCEIKEQYVVLPSYELLFVTLTEEEKKNILLASITPLPV